MSIGPVKRGPGHA